MDNRIKKAIYVIHRKCLKPFAYVSNNFYQKMIVKHYKKLGMNIIGTPFYIHPDVYFDGSDYGLITLEDGCSISRDVIFLTHDFSMNTVYKGLELTNMEELENEYRINRLKRLHPIHVGKHTFIGARSFILPGSDIGSNVLIGGGSVVRGKIPDNSVVMGNPAVVVKKTSEWFERKKF